MPLSAPTYGAAYNQTEQNTNAGTLTTAINTNTTAAADAQTDATAAQSAITIALTAIRDACDALLSDTPGPSHYSRSYVLARIDAALAAVA